MDIHTEAKVEQALRSVLAGTTAVVVAHRASTVQLADRVALLVDGRIAAVGTHSQLMATVPAYQDLLASRSDVTSAATHSAAIDSQRKPIAVRSSPAKVSTRGRHRDRVRHHAPRSFSTRRPTTRGAASPPRTPPMSPTAVGIKLQARSRRLLGSLVRPHRWWALLAGAVVVISELAYLVGPLAVAYGIDVAVAGADRRATAVRWSSRR